MTAVQTGWVKDNCHGDVKTGDIVIASYRGTPHQPFTVLEDTGTGMFNVRRPDGSEGPMRPSTILKVADRIIREL